jgi:hypothetical protein
MKQIAVGTVGLLLAALLHAQTPEELSRARAIDPELTDCLASSISMPQQEREFWISNMPQIRDQGNLGELRAICYRERKRNRSAETVRKIIADYGDSKSKGNHCDFFWIDLDIESQGVDFIIKNRCGGGEDLFYKFTLSELDTSSIRAYEDSEKHFWYVTIHTKNLQRTIFVNERGRDSKTSVVRHFGRFSARDAEVARNLAQAMKALAETALQ